MTSDRPEDPAGVPAASARPGRRSLVTMLVVFGALTLALSGSSLVARAVKARHPSVAMDATPADVRAFLGPIAEGAWFAGWHIARIQPSGVGHVTLELQSTSDERFIVDVHARSSAGPPGLAETASLAIYLRREQHGAPTPEPAVRACSALASALRAREEAGHKPPSLESIAPPP